MMVWSLNDIFSTKRHTCSLNLVQRKGAESAHRPCQYEIWLQMSSATCSPWCGRSFTCQARRQLRRLLSRDVAILKSDGAIRPRKRVRGAIFIVILFKKWQESIAQSAFSFIYLFIGIVFVIFLLSHFLTRGDQNASTHQILLLFSLVPLLFLYYYIFISEWKAKDDGYARPNNNCCPHFPLLCFTAAEQTTLSALETYRLKPSYVFNNIKTLFPLPYHKTDNTVASPVSNSQHILHQCVSAPFWHVLLIRK